MPRWLDHLATYGGHELPHIDTLAAWLTANRPADAPPGIVHGDYHLNNVLLDRAEPKIAAVVDWEMCTVGDPLLDLGWLLVTWPDGAGEAITGGRLAELGGLPTRTELAEHYAARSARDLAALDWYTALAGFKFAIIIEGTNARARAGQADRATGDALHRGAVTALERAAAIAGV